MGIPTLIGSAHTASGADSIDITSGIDSTYDEYMFVYTNMHPNTNDTILEIQFNASGGSGFDETITSTAFRARHTESDSATELTYETDDDLVQETDGIYLCHSNSNGADENAGGIIHLFNPSSTTYVKHFYATNTTNRGAEHDFLFCAGYINTTAAIDEIQFKMQSGTLDAVVQMYGIA
tara:strand:- start:23 stop:559 length:537 start_codon:yes stop_codon:yes gene_type:complete